MYLSAGALPCGVAWGYGRQVLKVGDVIMKVDGVQVAALPPAACWHVLLCGC